MSGGTKKGSWDRSSEGSIELIKLLLQPEVVLWAGGGRAALRAPLPWGRNLPWMSWFPSCLCRTPGSGRAVSSQLIYSPLRNTLGTLHSRCALLRPQSLKIKQQREVLGWGSPQVVEQSFKGAFAPPRATQLSILSYLGEKEGLISLIS